MNYEDNNEIRNESENEATESEMPLQDEETTPEQTATEEFNDYYEEERAKQQSEEGSVVIPYEKEEKKAPAGKVNFGRLAVVAVAVCLIAAMAGACFAGVAYLVNGMLPQTSVPQVPSTSLPSGDGAETSDPTLNVNGTGEGITTAVTQVVDAVMPAMVSINVKGTAIVDYPFGFGSYEQEFTSSGSGIIILQNTNILYIVTNYHVIEGASSISVAFIDGEMASAVVKGYDPDYDLAVISVDLLKLKPSTLVKIKTVAIGSSDNIKLGEPAIAIGNALGYGQSVTVGYISAIQREVQIGDNIMSLIQTDAAINPGNSGGALLNIKGELLGINSAKLTSSGDVTVEGMGFAIPISDAVPIINDILNQEAIPEEEQGYLGIKGRSVVPSYDGYEYGLYVSEVTEGSPAANGGIMAQDIIVTFDGKNITSFESLSERLSRKRAGETVEITVMRRNRYGKFESVKLTVTLGSKNDAPKQ